MARRWLSVVAFLVAIVPLAGCGQLAWHALDQAGRYSAVPRPAPAVAVAGGHRVVQVVQGLNYPSAMTWDSEGNLYIFESHTIPIPFTHPRIVRVSRDGSIGKVKLEWPANAGESGVGLTFHEGWLYLTHEEKSGSFAISRVRPEGGRVEPVLSGIPSEGDHDVNHLVFDSAGTLYFGAGSATNSGVVSSSDGVNQKWLKKHPEVYELPCRDVVLRDLKFTEKNELTKPPDDIATTGAFQPYGKSGAHSVKGRIPCMGAVFKLAAGSATPALLAWGFRNPVALALDDAGSLYIGMQGADIRSTRPILDDPDAVYRLREGAWYGWPDYSAELIPITDPRYQPRAATSPLQFVIDHERSGLSTPDRSLLLYATRPHAAIAGMTYVPSSSPYPTFRGKLLVAEMGDFKSMTDNEKPDVRAGFQVEAVDRAGGGAIAAARNSNQGDPLPASELELSPALERPVDVRIGPDGLIYILDYGVFDARSGTPRVMPKTGRVFRIEPAGR